MKKEFRVKKNEDFQKIIKGKKLFSSSYVLYYLPNQIEHLRFGISASKKLGNAVIRSKVRRRVRSILQIITKEKNNYNYDIIIIVRKIFLENDFEKNKSELEKLLNIILGGKISEKEN